MAGSASDGQRLGCFVTGIRRIGRAMTGDLLSVVIPRFNASHHIAAAIRCAGNGSRRAGAASGTGSTSAPSTNTMSAPRCATVGTARESS